jgi:hypothetical protein
MASSILDRSSFSISRLFVRSEAIAGNEKEADGVALQINQDVIKTIATQDFASRFSMRDLKFKCSSKPISACYWLQDHVKSIWFTGVFDSVAE